MRQYENWQKRKYKVYRYKLQGQIFIINCNYSPECFLLDYRLLFLRFLLLTLSMCLFAGKDIAQKLLLF